MKIRATDLDWELLSDKQKIPSDGKDEILHVCYDPLAKTRLRMLRWKMQEIDKCRIGDDGRRRRIDCL